MAQLKQCSNGHYYDTSMYPSCPYCSGASVGIDRSVSDYGIKTTIPTGSVFTGSAAPTTGPASATPTVSPDSFINTVDVIRTNGSNGDTLPPDRLVIEDIPGTRPVWQPEKIDKKPEKPWQSEQPVQPDSDPTLPEKCVVGWIVAVKGEYTGKSFELHHGYNHIGREKGDIVLKKDPAISGEKNVSILYSKNNQFRIGAGQSTNEVYVNGEVLFYGSNVVLNPYDLIELGTSKFRFIPFCSEQFQWKKEFLT